MTSAAPLESGSPSRLRRWAGIVAVVWLAALLPILIAQALLECRWTHVEPPWGWLLATPLPLIGSAMAVSRVPLRAWRALAALVAAALLVSGFMLARGTWPAVASLLLAVTLPMLAAMLDVVFKARPPRLFGRAVLAWTGLVLGGGILAAYAEELVIARKAEAHANGRPYCLEYASQTEASDYEPVKTLFDLNGLKMRARLLDGGSTMFRFQNHAWLIVEKGDGRSEWLAWSYVAQAFVEGNGVTALRCAPASHYVETLPSW